MLAKPYLREDVERALRFEDMSYPVVVCFLMVCAMMAAPFAASRQTRAWRASN